MKWTVATLLSVLMITTSSLHAQTRPSPKVVCFGDSITQSGYPDRLAEILKVSVINSGVGGHSSAAGLKRIQKDVLDHKPAVVVILFGTNDTRLDAPQVHVSLEQYEANLATMVQRCHKAGAKVVLCTIPPINTEAYFKRHAKEKFDAAGGLDAVLERYRAAVRKLAEQKNAPLVDLAETLKMRPEWLSDDGVHPSKEGQQLVAEEVGKAVGPLLGG